MIARSQVHEYKFGSEEKHGCHGHDIVTTSPLGPRPAYSVCLVQSSCLLLPVSSQHLQQARVRNKECLTIPSAFAALSPFLLVSTYARASASTLLPSVRLGLFPSTVRPRWNSYSCPAIGHGCTETMCSCRCCRWSEKDLASDDGERAPLIQQAQPAPSQPMLADDR
jgi:hypothetical protein